MMVCFPSTRYVRNIYLPLGILIVCFAMFGRAHAAPGCEGGPINPIAKISWQCIFPITIAGVEINGTGNDDVNPGSALSPDRIGNPICVCPSSVFPFPTPGLRISFWNPAHWIDTTSNPGCMNALGVSLPVGGLQVGMRDGLGDGSNVTFQQAHYYLAPVWALLDLFGDLPCLSSEGFDIAYLSEVDPIYQHSHLALLAFPETAIFANPASALSCMADAASSTGANRPIDAMFWCMGSWGMTYPLSGLSHAGDYTEANAHIAARQIYRMSRLGLLWKSSPSACNEVPQPIWEKSLFKVQEMLPVKQKGCMNIGRSGIRWSSLKGPPMNQNYTWSVFERITCCANP